MIRPFLRLSPIPLTAGQRIDRQSARIIRQYCKEDFNCVDVGAHKGEILDLILSASPTGKHFAFEPIPYLYSVLKSKYGSTVELFQCALSDTNGTSSFHLVQSNPAYSGLEKRIYDRSHEDVKEITVELKRLDDCIASEIPIHFIKIDVEGAELLMLRGAERILSVHKPMLLFEHGFKGASVYDYDAGDLYSYLQAKAYKLYTLDGFIRNDVALTKGQLMHHFHTGDQFYFIAQ